MLPKDDIRLLFFADTHLGFDYPVRPRIERRRRGTDFFDNFHRVLEYAAESRVDLLVHGGDLFFRSRVPAKIVDMAYGALFEFADKGIPVVIVPGNHERSRLPTSLYLSHPNIYVFVEPTTFTFEVGGAKVRLSGFPFERKDIKSRFADILKKTGWEDADNQVKLLCLHQAIEGARVGPSNYTFRSGHDVITFDDLPRDFLAILAGHIHRAQVLTGDPDRGRDSVQVIYPGSIERTSFAEKEEEKGFYELTFRTGDDNSWRINKLDFHALPARPTVDLVIDGNVTGANVESFLRQQIARFDQNAVVRIKCTDGVDGNLTKQMTSSFFRSVFPATMNFQLSGAYFRSLRGVSDQ